MRSIEMAVLVDSLEGRGRPSLVQELLGGAPPRVHSGWFRRRRARTRSVRRARSVQHALPVR
jgi:hypothetical protein